jgi:hypothetical protein
MMSSATHGATGRPVGTPDWVVTGHLATTHYLPQIELGLMKLARLVVK